MSNEVGRGGHVLWEFLLEGMVRQGQDHYHEGNSSRYKGKSWAKFFWQPTGSRHHRGSGMLPAIRTTYRRQSKWSDVGKTKQDNHGGESPTWDPGPALRGFGRKKRPHKQVHRQTRPLIEVPYV